MSRCQLAYPDVSFVGLFFVALFVHGYAKADSDHLEYSMGSANAIRLTQGDTVLHEQNRYVTIAPAEVKATAVDGSPTIARLPVALRVYGYPSVGDDPSWGCIWFRKGVSPEKNCWVKLDALASADDFAPVEKWEGPRAGPIVVAGEWGAQFTFAANGRFRLEGEAASQESSSVTRTTGKLLQAGSIFWARAENTVERMRTLVEPPGEGCRLEDLNFEEELTVTHGSPSLDDQYSHFLFFTETGELCAVGNNDDVCHEWQDQVNDGYRRMTELVSR